MPKRKLQLQCDEAGPKSKTLPKKSKTEEDNGKVKRKYNVKSTSNAKQPSASKSKKKVVKNKEVPSLEASMSKSGAHNKSKAAKSSKKVSGDNEDLPVSVEALKEVHTICNDVLRRILSTAVQYQKHAHRKRLMSSDFDMALTQLGIEL